MKWELICSKDAIEIDYVEIIEANEEPGFWECYEIADQHGCEWWSLNKIEEEDLQ